MYKNILVISPIPSHPQDAGNRTRIYNFLINLQKLGHEVHFLYIQQELGDESQMRQTWEKNYYSLPYTQPTKGGLTKRITRQLKKLLTGYPVYPDAVDDWYDPSVNKFLIELQKNIKFDIVIVEYVFFSKALNFFSKEVLKIIDTHDVFNDRDKLFKRNGYQGEYGWYTTTIKEEIKGLRRADWIISIQKEEEEYFKSLLGNKVITIGHAVTLRKLQYFNQHNKNILFIGTRNYNNIQGINFFINKVLPQLRKKYPDVQLLIAGNVCSEVEQTDGCIKLGYIDDSQKNQVYDLVNVVINPILFGTGLKIKSIEALGQSKVLVTTSEGAKGLETGANKAFLLANNAEEFVEHLIEIFSNITLSNSLCENAHTFAETYNEEVFKPLKQILNCK